MSQIPSAVRNEMVSLYRASEGLHSHEVVYCEFQKWHNNTALVILTSVDARPVQYGWCQEMGEGAESVYRSGYAD